ncbi:MAG: Zn-dependent protease-like protein [Jatrophihabitans sp.]|nr:Zn-dependent protease-like protein [Jatrophihabitans sp.]
MRRRPRLLFLGRFFGVPLYFAPSWLLIAAILTRVYGPPIHRSVADISWSTAYLTAFAFTVLFALCVLAHELGHTAVSLALGSPVKRVVIFLLGGISEIEREPEQARDELLVAAAGPAVSGLLTGLAAWGEHALGTHTLPGVLATLLFWGNLSVLVFNLLPGLPLDGGRMLRAGIWGVAHSRLVGTRIGAWAGRALAVAMAALGIYLSGGQNGFIVGFVFVFMAAYLWLGATAALRSAEVLDRVPSVALPSLLRPGLMVPGDISVAEALTRVWAGSARGLVLVDSSDRPTAIVTESLIGDVPPERRAWTPLATVARALEPGLLIPIGLTGEALIDAIRATPASEYLVVNPDGSPAGILAITDLATTLKGAA